MSRVISSRSASFVTLLFAVVTVLGLSLSAAHAAPSVGKTKAYPMEYVAGGGFLA
jgi:hypothetical protein